MPEVVEIVRVKPNPGAKRKLIEEIRPRYIADLKRAHPGVLATVLVESTDDTLVDIIVFASAEVAHAAFADGANIPGLVEWRANCEGVSFELSEVLERTPAEAVAR